MTRMERLRHLHAKAKQLYDQLDAMAGECCELMGVDPESNSNDADRCRDIIFHGTAPDFVRAQLEAKR